MEFMLFHQTNLCYFVCVSYISPSVEFMLFHLWNLWYLICGIHVIPTVENPLFHMWDLCYSIFGVYVIPSVELMLFRIMCCLIFCYCFCLIVIQPHFCTFKTGCTILDSLHSLVQYNLVANFSSRDVIIFQVWFGTTDTLLFVICVSYMWTSLTYQGWSSYAS